ncbi:MAG: prepilin-type N-terminal cleavage/methylation domain-containing protein [Magnetococcales bacterium]|nr:prepilin-type N-terminal cleavage/methylation domain-containing protein [Magnetococcales bacterium]MBF0114384.1 prepilin-type N-terminal cleavage/methylation domain-containing protein [Magnetococcales bacterium]
MPQAGLTLLELLLTLLLLAIVLVVAAPQWPNSLLLAAQAEQLAQDLRYTQALAMQRQQTHTIQWSTLQRYTIRDATNQPITAQPPELAYGVTAEPFTCSFAATTGQPNAASRIPLHLGNETRTLQVNALTGLVTLQP